MKIELDFLAVLAQWPLLAKGVVWTLALTALSAVLETQRARLALRLDVGQGLMRDFLLAMSPEARLAFADRLEQRLHHGGKAMDDGSKGAP